MCFTVDNFRFTISTVSLWTTFHVFYFKQPETTHSMQHASAGDFRIKLLLLLPPKHQGDKALMIRLYVPVILATGIKTYVRRNKE